MFLVSGPSGSLQLDWVGEMLSPSLTATAGFVLVLDVPISASVWRFSTFLVAIVQRSKSTSSKFLRKLAEAVTRAGKGGSRSRPTALVEASPVGLEDLSLSDAEQELWVLQLPFDSLSV